MLTFIHSIFERTSTFVDRGKESASLITLSYSKGKHFFASYRSYLTSYVTMTNLHD